MLGFIKNLSFIKQALNFNLNRGEQQSCAKLLHTTKENKIFIKYQDSQTGANFSRSFTSLQKPPIATSSLFIRVHIFHNISQGNPINVIIHLTPDKKVKVHLFHI
jgi:hypothetical protein